MGDRKPLDRLEEMHIRRVLATTRSLDEAASVLEIDLATLWRSGRSIGSEDARAAGGSDR